MGNRRKNTYKLKERELGQQEKGCNPVVERRRGQWQKFPRRKKGAGTFFDEGVSPYPAQSPLHPQDE